jgi:hypothetical protein
MVWGLKSLGSPPLKDYMKQKRNLHIDEKKGMGQEQHWEKHVPFQEGNPNGFGAFNPMSGKHRPQVYNKTNECDH